MQYNAYALKRGSFMKKNNKQSTNTATSEMLPVVPTMDIVVFPRMIVPLLVLDERIIKGIEKALEGESKTVFLIASRKQSNTHSGAIGTKDLFEIGTVGSIMRLIKIPEGGIKILVQGLHKGLVQSIAAENDILHAQVQKITTEINIDDPQLTATIKSIKDISEQMSLSGQALSPDFHLIVSKMHDPEKIAEFILSHLTLNVEAAQKLLECDTFNEFLKQIYLHISQEIEVAQTQERIKNSTRDAMNKSQKEFYLREQLKAIKKELGDEDAQEIEKIRAKLEELTINDEARTEIHRQVNRLEKTSPDSMEAAVLRNYLDWVLALPWNTVTTDNLDLAHAQQVLDEDHYGLKEIKDRILDFISIKKLNKDGYAPILCFSGPPGTGKTSLGKSIARSLGRNYHRISLGGVKDEAEIRGHRRTYVGAMPGRFIQGLRKAGSLNPVIIIDELDKIGADFRGDPSAAMLEILDPQQNKTFYDNYLGIPFDLSQVLFVATANNIENLSEPLRDRMEIIHLSGYTTEEKMEIAKRHLWERSLNETGLHNAQFKIDDLVLQDIVASYTREAGVRELDRLLKKLCSKVARIFVEKNQIETITHENLELYLGARRFMDDENVHTSLVGITNGLAWTSVGGELLKIEAITMPGKGRLLLTGQLGDVMKESAQAALSYACAHAEHFGIDLKMFTECDLHIHVPAGAIPKDGPSAGITMLSSILSALTKRPINSNFAMTGELNLRGDVMRIGGVKEKILAAKRNNINRVILPHKNKQDLVGLDDVIKDMDLIWVQNAQEVIDHVLMPHADVKPVIV